MPSGEDIEGLGLNPQKFEPKRSSMRQEQPILAPLFCIPFEESLFV